MTCRGDRQRKGGAEGAGREAAWVGRGPGRDPDLHEGRRVRVGPGHRHLRGGEGGTRLPRTLLFPASKTSVDPQERQRTVGCSAPCLQYMGSMPCICTQVYKALRDGVQDVAVKKLKVDATANGVQAFLEVHACCVFRPVRAVVLCKFCGITTALWWKYLTQCSHRSKREVLHVHLQRRDPARCPACAGVQHPQVAQLRQEHCPVLWCGAAPRRRADARPRVHGGSSFPAMPKVGRLRPPL